MGERFTELDVIELGPWCDYIPDGPSSLEHRIAKANGLTYGCPPRHWKWKAPVTERMRVPKELPADFPDERDVEAARESFRLNMRDLRHPAETLPIRAALRAVTENRKASIVASDLDKRA